MVVAQGHKATIGAVSGSSLASKPTGEGSVVASPGAGCPGITAGGGWVCTYLHIHVQCVCVHMWVHVYSSWDIPHQGRDHPVRQDPTGCPVRDPPGHRRGDPGLGTHTLLGHSLGTALAQPWHQPPAGPWFSNTHPANSGQHHAAPRPSPHLRG